LSETALIVFDLRVTTAVAGACGDSGWNGRQSARAVGIEDVLERVMWFCWQLDGDVSAGHDNAVTEHDGHDADDPDDAAVAVAVAQQRHEPVLKLVDLDAWMTKTRQLDGCLGAEPQHAPLGSETTSRPCVVMFSPRSPASTW